tara:strand:- start:854 stop:1507 length:654 start_codon:yes stop_codon:yes gene_type:complete
MRELFTFATRNRFRMQSPYAPLPGSGLPVRALFVDRWGTLLERPEQGWTPDFHPNLVSGSAVDGLFHACQQGWSLYLIGNEDQVVHGQMSDENWSAFEAQLVEHLRSHGVPVTRCYAGLDHPDGKKPHNKDSVFYLPNTGAMYHAAQEDGVILKHSWVIGDSTPELVAGWRAGCKLAGVRTGLGLADHELQVEPEFTADDLGAVLREVVSGAYMTHH